MTRKNLLINIGLLVASVIVFLGGVEICLRVSGLMSTQSEPSRLFAKPYLQNSIHPEIGYELKPGFEGWAHFSTVTTNSLGFRSPELDSDKPSMAILGDSMVFGYGVEDDETLSAYLQSVFPSYNVINAGVPGYDLEQETATYEYKIAPLRPELLILVFYFNDFIDSGRSWVDEDGILRPEGWTPEQRECQPIEGGLMGLIPGKCWLDLHSAFYLAVKKTINLRTSIKEADEDREKAKESQSEDPVKENDLRIYASDLQKLASLLPADLPRLFVVWPDRYFHADSIPKLTKIAEDRGFTVMDLYEVIGNDAEVLSWDYTHPAPSTLLKAAKSISEVIRREEWLSHAK